MKDPHMGPLSFFAKKKDRQLSLCVDYCALNKNTISNLYPIPHIEEKLSWLKGAQCFMFDIRDGYFCVPIVKENIRKMVFSGLLWYV